MWLDIWVIIATGVTQIRWLHICVNSLYTGQSYPNKMMGYLCKLIVIGQLYPNKMMGLGPSGSVNVPTNGKTRLRLEFIVNNGHCMLRIEWQVRINFAWDPSLSTPRLCLFWTLHAYYSSLTVPMSHHKYNKWQDKVEIGIHCQQWSLHARIEWRMMINFAWADPPLSTPRLCFFDPRMHITAAWPFYCFIMTFLNSETRLRLKSVDGNH